MVLLPIIVLFMGIYILYNTSKRVEFKLSAIQKWVRRDYRLAKSVGLGLLIISFFLFVVHYGLGAGVLIAMIMLMAIGSLVVIISPIKRGHKL